MTDLPNHSSLTNNIYQYVNPYSMRRIERTSLLDASSPNGVFLSQPEFDRNFLRYSPEFIDDPSETNMFCGLVAAVYTSPPVFLCAASQAAVVGFRAVLSEGQFFLDQEFSRNPDSVINHFSIPGGQNYEDTGMYRQESSDRVTLDIGARKIQHIEGCAVSVMSAEPSNYGSFLFRVLPKIIAIKNFGLIDLPIIMFTGHSSYVDLLEMVGIKRSNIVSHHPAVAITTADRLLVPSLRNPNAFLDYESRILFREMAYSFGCSIKSRKRIYISRLSHAKAGRTTRVMLNEEELIARLSAIGFEIIEPENLSVQDQIKIFSSADMVVGPSGAAMFNTVFCAPGTKIIDIESESHWIYAHAGLFASCELRYGIFIGEQNPADPKKTHRSWTVNIDALVDRIERFR